VKPKSGVSLLSGEDKETVKEAQDKNKQLLGIPRRWGNQKALLMTASSFFFPPCFWVPLNVIACVMNEDHILCISTYSNPVVNEFVVF
jgi:hypothetical protein